jgi:hypothetical protein
MEEEEEEAALIAKGKRKVTKLGFCFFCVF